MPTPFTPGTPTVGEPEALVSMNRLLPLASRPAGLRNVASCRVPTTVGAVAPAVVTWTWPACEMVMLVEPAGMVIWGITW